MNILILEGPNLNLLGLKSVSTKSRLTLDKLNKSIKSYVGKHHNLKFLQTHKEYQAINFLQRNRNWATGILFIPTSWARNGYTILETINLIKLKTAVVFFESKFNFGTSSHDSIINGEKIKPFSGQPPQVCYRGLDYLTK